MYRNLEAEMIRTGVGRDRLATEIGCTVGTLSLKLHKKAPITLEQAATIKKALGVGIPLEELFEWSDDASNNSSGQEGQ